MFDLIETAHAGVITDAIPVSQVLANTLRFLLQVFGILGIISLVVSAVMLYLSAGDPEREKKAKKGIMYSIIGMAIILGGMVIIKTVAGVL